MGALDSILVELARQAQREAGVYGRAQHNCAPDLQPDTFMHGKSKWSRFWGPAQWGEWGRMSPDQQREATARAVWGTVADRIRAEESEARRIEAVARREAAKGTAFALNRFIVRPGRDDYCLDWEAFE